MEKQKFVQELFQIYKKKKMEIRKKIAILDGLTVDEYFSPDSTTKKDIGRPQAVKEKRQTFKGSAWITEECPISLVDELIPILDILCNFNDAVFLGGRGLLEIFSKILFGI